MPDITGWEPLVSYLWEMGPVVAAGQGLGPISHGEIWCWQQNTGIELDAWEVRTLRHLSDCYLSQSIRSENPDEPPPWTPDAMPEHDKEAVSQKVSTTFRALAMSQRNRRESRNARN